MTEPRIEHDPAADRVIDMLAEIDPDQTLRSMADSVGDPAVREYLETIGLMPYAEPAAIPDPAIRVSLLARIATSHATSNTAGGSIAPVVAFPSSPSSSRSSTSSRARSWTMALAAMLGFCVLGLAYLAGQVSEQRSSIAELEALLSRPLTAALGASNEHALREALAHSESTKKMITEIARVAYPMRSVGRIVHDGATNETGSSIENDQARGIVYVCGRHQQWYLSLQGLEPAPAGFAYNLWFETPAGAVHAGVLEIEEGELAEMAAPIMPEGTSSFMVTIEREGARDSPQGKPVMIADHSISL